VGSAASTATRFGQIARYDRPCQNRQTAQDLPWLAIVLIDWFLSVDSIPQTVCALDQRLEELDVRFLLNFAVVALAALGTAQVQAQWPQTTSPGNCGFWAEANGAVYDRPGTDLGLSLIFDSVTLAPLYTSDDVTDLNTTVGADFRFGNNSRMCGPWEFGASIASWDTHAVVQGANLESPFFPGFSPDRVDFFNESQFYDLEFNLRRAFAPGFTFLYGVRYLDLSDKLQYVSETDFGAIDFFTDDVIETSNSAIGGQVGLEYNMPLAQTVYVQGFIKVAGLGNATKVDRVSSTTLNSEISSRDTKGIATFVGQAGGRVYFELLPRHLHTYAGYEATWIDGVAVAPPQFLSTGTDPVVTANTIFWHAITFGLRFQY
jgi:hypothetical protein